MSGSLIAFTDLDFDGVDDKSDLCPSSLFSDLVDKNGCKVDSIIISSKHNFDISISNYNSEKSEYNSKSISLSYFYDDFSWSISNSYYTYKTEDYNETIQDQGDYQIDMSYTFKPIKDFKFSVNSAMIIPPSDNEYQNTDLLVGASYSYNIIDNIIFSGGLTYTFVNDTNLSNDKYDNSYSLTMGGKYTFSSSAYISSSYSQSSNLQIDDSKSVSIYLGYYFYNGIYSIFNIEKELNFNESVSNSFKIGYFF